MSKKVVDKHGRRVAAEVLYITPNDRTPQKCTSAMAHAAHVHISAWAAAEILAINWIDSAPEKFEPPRDAKGIPICVGDTCLHTFGLRFEFDSANMAALRKHPSWEQEYTIVRFVGEELDIGKGSGEWTWDTPSAEHFEEQYRHTSGAKVARMERGIAEINSKGRRWTWCTTEELWSTYGQAVDSRKEAERLALAGLPSSVSQCPWTATGRDLDALLDAAGTRRLDSDDEEARQQLLRALWPRGPKQVVELLEAGVLEARRGLPYGTTWSHPAEESPGHRYRWHAMFGLARVVAWAISGERMRGDRCAVQKIEATRGTKGEIR